MGNKDLTDGLWVFPEGLAHYLRMHSVKPDSLFLEHIRQNEYKIPELKRVIRERRNCMLLDRIVADLKRAMKSRETLRVAVLRMALAEAENARIEKIDNLTDEEVGQLLRREVEKREEAETLYRRGNRPDLADKEADEAVILRSYLAEAKDTI